MGLCRCQGWVIPHVSVNAEGYKYVVIHISLLEVVHNGVFVDLREKHHVVHSTLFDIVALPVVPEVAPAPLYKQTNRHTHTHTHTA